MAYQTPHGSGGLLIRALTTMDDGRASLIVLSQFDAPVSLEGAERRQDRSTNPDAVLSLGGSDDLDLVRIVSVPSEQEPNC